MNRTRSLGILAVVLFSLAVQTLPASTLPRKAPDFAIQMTDGKQLQLSSYKGKPLVLAFILTTCSHCQNFTRLLIRAHKDYASRGLQIVESAIEDKAAPAVPGFIHAFQPPFPVGYNEYVKAVDFLQHPAMQILPMPVVVFLDRQGTIVAQYTAKDDFMQDGVVEKNVRAKIEELVGRGATPAKAPAKGGVKKAAVPAKKQ
jgi:peroxiredoxin